MFWLTGALLPLTLLLSAPDPAGDASGDGSYLLPSLPAMSATQADLRLFKAENVDGKLRLSVALGSVGNPWKAPGGFSGITLDFFIKTKPGGVTELSGLGLRVPGSSGWQEHYRVNGFEQQHFSADAAGKAQPSADLPRLSWQGTDLSLSTDLPAGRYSYWVTSSLYTPLSRDGLLRPGGDTSDLGLRSARADSPVPLDVLLSGDQKAVYATRVLLPVGQTRDVRALSLLALSGLGLLVAVFAGIWAWRRT